MARIYRIAALLALLLPQPLLAQSRPASSAGPKKPVAAPATPSVAPSAPAKNYAYAGQRELTNALSIALSAGGLQVRDAALLPVVHRGLASRVALGYRRLQGHSLHEAEFEAALATPSSRLDAGSQHIALDLRYSYLHHVADLGDYDERHRKPASLWLGALVGGGPSIQSYPDIDEAHAYWHTRYQIQPVAMLYWQAKPKLAWIQRLDIPLASVVSRPAAHRTYFNDIPALGDTMQLAHTRLQPEFAHRAGRLRGLSSLEYPLHKRVHQRVSYALSYDYARTAARYQALEHMLQWYTSWSF